MKNNININPIGLKGNEINERMKELMGIKPINENDNKSKSVIELTKRGPDGNAYAIVRENHEYFIKTSAMKSNLVAEDFNYIGGLQNKKSEAYPSYAKAIKHLNLKFNSLTESLNTEGKVNVFENDNLVSENGTAGSFADMPKGGGFTGEGNLEGNTPLPVNEEEIEAEETEEELTEEELTEEEKAIEEMCKEEDEVKEEEVKETITEHKLSIVRALENMDAIIDGLTEGKLKKKIYTIK